MSLADDPDRRSTPNGAAAAPAGAGSPDGTGPDGTGPDGTGPDTNDPDTTDPREAIIEHLPALRVFALSLSRNGAEADDLVQDTLLKAWSKFDQFSPGTNLRAWLFTILRNGFNSLRRKRAREVPDIDGAMAAQLASKPDHDGRMALADLADAFRQLPREQREALLLVGAMGFSVDEAAETCNCAPGTIKSRANRGRRALAELLGLKDGEGMDLTDQATLAVMSTHGASAG